MCRQDEARYVYMLVLCLFPFSFCFSFPFPFLFPFLPQTFHRRMLVAVLSFLHSGFARTFSNEFQSFVGAQPKAFVEFVWIVV